MKQIRNAFSNNLPLFGMNLNLQIALLLMENIRSSNYSLIAVTEIRKVHNFCLSYRFLFELSWIYNTLHFLNK